VTRATATVAADGIPLGGAAPRSYQLSGDAELLRESARDPEAFGAFYDRHATAVLAYFQRRLACPHAAADLTAETFAAAFLARRRFRDTGAPASAWLFTIAKRQLANMLRRERIDTRARSRLGIERVDLDDAALLRIEELADLVPVRARLEAALGELSPESVEAVRMRVDEELPYSEIADRLNCTEGAARVRVARALSRLADEMEVDR
jgi:RNA polymerase sigma-70 factor (ECF subfamily)